MRHNESISQKPGWFSASLGNELVMMNASSGVYLNLLGPGGRIWELIQVSRTIESICDALLAEYDVQPSEIRDEVLTFLEDLKKYDAVQFMPCGD